jgi:hypothetical protein
VVSAGVTDVTNKGLVVRRTALELGEASAAESEKVTAAALGGVPSRGSCNVEMESILDARRAERSALMVCRRDNSRDRISSALGGLI